MRKESLSPPLDRDIQYLYAVSDASLAGGEAFSFETSSYSHVSYRPGQRGDDSESGRLLHTRIDNNVSLRRETLEIVACDGAPQNIFSGCTDWSACYHCTRKLANVGAPD